MRLHPGGFKLLFKNAGGDSTADFLALRHSAKSRVILDAYYVGELGAQQRTTLGVHSHPSNSGADVGRPVGSMVTPQPFLSVGPRATNPVPATPTPTPTYSYPLPRSGPLHPSTSHPDRLTAYTEHQSRAKPSSIPLTSSSSASGGLSINLHPPSPVPATLYSSPVSPVREDPDSPQPPPLSPTLSAPLPSSTQAMPPPVANTRAASDNVETKVILPTTSTGMLASTVATIPTFGPRLFALAKRTQRTHNVQLLEFVPIFPTPSSSPPTGTSSLASASSSGASSASSSSMVPRSTRDAVVESSTQPSSMDPALWLHVPIGMHVSIGCRLANGEYVKRQYTPVTNIGGELSFLIKRYDSGVISSFLHSLEIGSPIDIYGPFGSFDYAESLRSYSRWVMIAQGTGVTVFWPLIRQLYTNSQDELSIRLLDCNRTEADILLMEEIEEMTNKSGGRFKVQHLISQVISQTTTLVCIFKPLFFHFAHTLFLSFCLLIFFVFSLHPHPLPLPQCGRVGLALPFLSVF